jgi:putative thioredoxin
MSVYALDVSAVNFDQVVIEGSRHTPVLVDFWAEWCGPCRILGPVLEKLAAEYEGRFVLAKINADQNGELSARYGVRGIPAVKAFVNGTVVDEFSGALSEREVRAFIDGLMPSPADELRAKARSLAQSGEAAAAIDLLVEASRLDPKNEAVRVDAADIMVNLGQLEEARRLLASLSPDTVADPRVQQLLAKLGVRGPGRGGRRHRRSGGPHCGECG